MVGEEFRSDDPTARIIRPKKRRYLPRPAKTDQLREALEGRAESFVVGSLWPPIGLRCQEVAGLDADDVLTEERLLRVTRGKGDKERMLPLHPEVAEALAALPMPGRGPVFRRPMGGAYNPWMVSQHFNKWLREAGVEATAHQLRHWFGTNVYQQTRDLRLTQEVLGHSEPQTTAVYCAFDRSQAAKAVGTLGFG